MNESPYAEALMLLDRATALLQTREVLSRVDLLYGIRELRRAFDAWRVQQGQAAPELERN